jgi:hypothetical protein
MPSNMAKSSPKTRAIFVGDLAIGKMTVVANSMACQEKRHKVNERREELEKERGRNRRTHHL